MNYHLKVDNVIPEYDNSVLGIRLRGIWVYIGDASHYFECDEYSICDPDKVRENGRQQCVELAKKLTSMKYTDKTELFGFSTAAGILSHFSYEEIVEKLDAWKKEKETIRVRDEVCHQTMQVRFVVTKIITPPDGDVIVNGLKKDGTAVKGLLLCNVEKTGLHVDDIDSYLEV